ncbi:hypothetical protein [Acidiplasma sp. MBA-1]|uniref:hypothetical protein n=1 Tax=Acidiplasma sp. MBA-1 TaxID=1293648 RepID=UPI00064FDA6D|nr:hypothetical protein [Acidiplasma sp. MBA-1]
MTCNNLDINEISAKLSSFMYLERKQRKIASLDNNFYSSISEAFRYIKSEKERALNEGNMDEYMKIVSIEGHLNSDFSSFMKIRLSKILQYSVYDDYNAFNLAGPEKEWMEQARKIYMDALKNIEDDSQ